ncbi:MAG: hypothetical protein NZ869_11075 [Thermoanaerobaculum sp.]|nr:hypothetical protein [Thermoanaerobaculum sp.]MDW7967643.1 hypothetical protein [Thermoanaerobaculum sp.]
MAHWQAAMWSWWAQVGGSGEVAPSGLAQALKLSPFFVVLPLLVLALPLVVLFLLFAWWRTYQKVANERLLTYQRARQHWERLEGSLQEILQAVRTRQER